MGIVQLLFYTFFHALISCLFWTFIGLLYVYQDLWVLHIDDSTLILLSVVLSRMVLEYGATVVHKFFLKLSLSSSWPYTNEKVCIRSSE